MDLIKGQKGVIYIVKNHDGNVIKTVLELEGMEKEVCNLPMLFAEVFKDEINANDEKEMYDGIKEIINKYSDNQSAISVINEFTSVISGGASLLEILQIVKDEAVSPTLASRLTVDESCELPEKE